MSRIDDDKIRALIKALKIDPESYFCPFGGRCAVCKGLFTKTGNDCPYHSENYTIKDVIRGLESLLK